MPTPLKLAKATAAAALPLAWANYALPALGLRIRGRSAANATAATIYATVFHGTPNWLSTRGLRTGGSAAALILTGYGVALSIPSVRRHLAELDRSPEVSHAEWASTHIPGGTVYSEELVYRATLNPILDDTFGDHGKWLGALVFGFAHIQPARSVGDPVPATVAVTALAGLAFDELRCRTGSATAPALAHLALNAGGALAPAVARRIEHIRTVRMGASWRGWRFRNR
ncbi:CPBP family intramembrane metalloprotease [Nocardia sp. 2]|uniref:CPBP family intramembrane metalloprotease n=1 Tax=Nocardia acididurans TaxID=2802282 RepID=A0ABS1MAE9_9NOCA|nr:CPBP family intramembrane glutamic endopeptidase [Nocardia acididurans]MBL1077582.1 CPBP family intramembrane metalloprotease [Nocardia acididurans]